MAVADRVDAVTAGRPSRPPVDISERRRQRDLIGGRPETLTRAVTFIEAQAGLGIRIGDIARAAGVSPRALQLTFRRHLGMTPMAYARQVRIAHAHRELTQAATGDGTTVTRVALDWGFANASRFARYYRTCYGRRPGDTLRED